MAGKPIQEQFGQVIIDAVSQFAAVDLQSPSTLEAGSFSHVGDAKLRRRLCEVFYGARWIYKLGLALLVKDQRQSAHVRAQITDYAAVCEGALLDMFEHALVRQLLTGQRYTFQDAARLRNKITWVIGSHRKELSFKSLAWFILVADEERIITPRTAAELQWLRVERNHVHVRAYSRASYVDKSKKAFEAVHLLLNDTKRWRQANP